MLPSVGQEQSAQGWSDTVLTELEEERLSMTFKGKLASLCFFIMITLIHYMMIHTFWHWFLYIKKKKVQSQFRFKKLKAKWNVVKKQKAKTKQWNV